MYVVHSSNLSLHFLSWPGISESSNPFFPLANQHYLEKQTEAALLTLPRWQLRDEKRAIKTSNKADLAKKKKINLSLTLVYLQILNLQNKKEQNIYKGVKQPKPVTAALILKILKSYQNS